MSKIRIICPLLCLFILTPTISTHAYTPGNKLIFSLAPGLAFFLMQDLNRKINQEQSGFMDITATEHLNPLSFGLDWSNSLHYGLHDNFIIGMEFNYLTTNTSAKIGAGPLNPPQDIYYDISVPAVELTLLGKSALSLSSSILLTIGAGISTLALVDAGETIESRGTLTGRVYTSSDLNYKGVTTGFKLFAGIDFFIWDWFSLGLEGGYRHARFENIRAELSGVETTLTNQDHSDFSLDYSGAFIHYTFRFYF